MEKRFQNKYQFYDIRGIQKIKKLAYVLNERVDFLTELVVQKENYYSPFVDTKKGKTREIDNPQGELKKLQTKIRDRVIRLLPLSPAIFGAVVGKSTKSNAEQHLAKPVLIKMDLENCFHNTKSRRVKQLFKKRFGYSEEAAYLLTELCTYKGHVPVGATLSSELVNAVLNPLWENIYKYCLGINLSFSVWGDDLSMSGINAEKSINIIKKMINDYGYKINWSKTKICRRAKQEQVVTGCGVNTAKTTVPKNKRNEYARQILREPNSTQIKGRIAFARFINKQQAKQLEKLSNKLANKKIA